LEGNYANSNPDDRFLEYQLLLKTLVAFKKGDFLLAYQMSGLARPAK